jgi:hypothetical protein
MLGKFEKNKLRMLHVLGNAESVYYNRNEQSQLLETITIEISSNIEFILNNGEIETIKYMTKSDGKTYPPSQFPDDFRKLKGFVWREEEQPKTKEDIFIDKGEIDTSPVRKGVPLKKEDRLTQKNVSKKDKNLD